MPKYTFTITRDATESQRVTVQADSLDQAHEQVLSDPPEDGWNLDDGNDHEVYLPDESDFDMMVPMSEVSVRRGSKVYPLMECGVLCARCGENDYSDPIALILPDDNEPILLSVLRLEVTTSGDPIGKHLVDWEDAGDE